MLRFVFVCAVGTWLGITVCFSWLVLPIIHRVSAPGDATRLLRHLFPRYYVAGMGCGLVALAAVSLGRSEGALPLGEALRLALPVTGCLLGSAVAYFGVLPRLQAERDGIADPVRIARLHGVSAMVNSTVIALLVLAVAGAVTR